MSWPVIAFKHFQNSLGLQKENGTERLLNTKRGRLKTTTCRLTTAKGSMCG
jgi:hypothetical protein